MTHADLPDAQAMPLKERPILFSAPMVRALLIGSKTQTRRIVKPQPQKLSAAELQWKNGLCAMNRLEKQSPYGVAGDRLWVRETWAQPTSLDPSPVFYFADYPACVPSQYENVPQSPDDIRWSPSIHMFRWMSRITLRITGVRVERLQDISRGDAMAEGCPFANMAAGPDPRHWYAELWQQINGASSWDVNPWVWVVEFERLPSSAPGTPT